MKEFCSCGFIIAKSIDNVVSGWLLCHPTNAGNRWDLPKGAAEPGEDHLKAALRELYEETEMSLFSLHNVIDLGQHPYQDKKDLHLFYIDVGEIDTKSMRCTSMVQNQKGPDFPEMDAFAVFEMDKISSKIGKRLNDWILTNVPKELLTNYV